MFCPKCGKQLPDGSKFCAGCGNNLVVQTENSKVEVKAKQFTGNGISQPNAKVDLGKFKKYISKKNIIIAIIALFVIIGVCVVLSSSRSDNAYVYLSDGNYELITNMKKGESIEIAGSKSDESVSSLVDFSSDGKYVYYYTKYDNYYGSGTLCRAEYNKLKEDSDKNDKYIEIIATNINLGFVLLEDDTLLYKNTENTLYYFDGKEETRIAKDVSQYSYNESGQISYLVMDENGEQSLYGVNLTDIDDKIKFDSNVQNVYYLGLNNMDNILYTKCEEDYSSTLYVVGFDKESEKICDNSQFVTLDTDKFYFLSVNGDTLNLYDYVDDSYVESDANLKEPTRDDFEIPNYKYKMIYGGSNLVDSDYEELYTSCTEELYLYGEANWNCYSMAEATSRSWGDNTETLVAATQNFIDKYADTANDEGYILVTDEVKASLMEIQQADDDPDSNWKWLWLCYERYQSGTTVDYDAYELAYAEWNKAQSRIQQREYLQNTENNYPLKTLYYVENGEVSIVEENILASKSYNGGIMYNTTESIGEKISMDDVLLGNGVQNLFAIDEEAENHVVLTESNTVCTMSESAAEAFAEAGVYSYDDLVFTDEKVFMFEDSDTLSVAEISNGVVEDFEILTDEAKFLSLDGSSLYYASDIYESNNYDYYDIYLYENGESTRLVKDALNDFTVIYEDGAIMVYTNFSYSSGYELTMIDAKGQATVIADDVTQYIRVDNSTLLYISDGDLYSYDGKDKNKIGKEVDWIWSQNEMQVSSISYGNDYSDTYDYY